MSDQLTIFIGSGEASILERKTLIYSIRKHTSGKPLIRIFNGTHNTIENLDGSYPPAPMSLNVKYKNVTEFSNYRFYIPTICGYQGRAVWLDSDMVCLADIMDLIAMAPENVDIAARPDAYGLKGPNRWGLSVSVMNCATCRFDPDLIFSNIDQGLFSYEDFHQLSEKFLEYHPMRISEIPEEWNSFDYANSKTKLIHYTNLYTQPWKAVGHPYGKLWFKYFNEARTAGFITKRDIELTLARSYVRQSILAGNIPGPMNIAFNFSRLLYMHICNRYSGLRSKFK